MKKFSIRLILIVLLLVGGPTVLNMVMEFQEKEHLSTPISDTDQTSFDDETEECDSWGTSPYLKPIKYFTSKVPATFCSQVLIFSRPNIIILPPPKIK